jgi:hypothetical protein
MRVYRVSPLFQPVSSESMKMNPEAHTASNIYLVEFHVVLWHVDGN